MSDLGAGLIDGSVSRTAGRFQCQCSAAGEVVAMEDAAATERDKLIVLLLIKMTVRGE